MEEHGMIEERLMLEKMERNKIQQKEDEAFQATLTENDKDDMETLKARGWEDWKDENEKGMGNRMRNL